jgi:hypothetical protein
MQRMRISRLHGGSAGQAPRARALLSALALLAVACGQSKAPDGAAAGPSSSGPGEAAGAGAAASPAPGEAGKAAPGKPRIQAAIKDLQLFHPLSADRSMPSVKDDGTVSTRDAKPRYGIGVIVEATNETGELLGDAWFEGAVRFTGSGGQEIVCEIMADVLAEFTGARFLSYAPKPTGKANPIAEEAAFGPKTDWKDESESLLESPWRPSERIRMLGRKNECETPIASDMGATGVKGRVVIKARKRFVDVYRYDFDDAAFELALDGDLVRIRDRRSPRIVVVPVKDVAEMTAIPGSPAGASPIPLSRVRLGRVIRASDADLVESEPVEFEIHPRAMTLQLVKLPTGELDHASGNVIIHQRDGKVVYEEMARLKMSLLGVERADLPAAPPEVAFQANELSGKVASITLVSSAEDAGLAKGQRKLSVAWKLNLKGDQIDGRLRTSLDAATAALDSAESAAFKLDMDTSADKAEVAKAKAAVAAAKGEKSAAEAKYKTGLSSERGRLAKLFVCGDARLATNKGLRTASNAKEASDACKALEKSDDVDAALTYTLDRYELPVAIVYSLGKAPIFSPIASEALLKLDTR